MGYIGPAPTSGFISNAKERYTGITTAYVDLNHSISSLADVIVWVNYVKQDATNLTLTSSTRITLGATLVSADIVEVAYLGKAVSTQAPATGQVTNDMLAGSIANSKLGADSVNASKIADDSISDEHLDITAITGQTAITSLADTDKFLVSDASDSGNLKYVENQYLGGGNHVLLASSESESNTSSINFDNVFSSTYSKYFISAHRMSTDSDNENIYIQVRISGSNQTSGAYHYILTGNKSNTTGTSDINVGYNSQAQWMATRGLMSTSYQGGASLSLWVFDPATSSYNTRIHGVTSFKKGSTEDYEVYTFGGIRSQTSVHDGIRIYPSSGNIQKHRVYIYGVKDS